VAGKIIPVERHTRKGIPGMGPVDLPKLGRGRETTAGHSFQERSNREFAEAREKVPAEQQPFLTPYTAEELDAKGVKSYSNAEEPFGTASPQTEN
jgi:hypothetical protein